MTTHQHILNQAERMLADVLAVFRRPALPAPIQARPESRRPGRDTARPRNASPAMAP